MSNQEMSLEELIYQVDSSSNDEFSQPTEPGTTTSDPFDDGIDGDEDTTEDPAEAENPEPQTDPETEPEAEPDNASDTRSQASSATNDESSEEDSLNIYKEYYDILKSNDMLFVPEDFEFDGTPEGLETAIQSTKANLSRAAAESLVQRFPEQFQPVLNYVLQGGQDVQNFLQSTAPRDVEQLPLDSVANQKAVLREYFKTTTDFDDEKITKLITRSELSDSLQEDASDAVEELRVYRKQLADELAKKAAEDKAKMEKLEQESRQQVFALIDDAPYIKTNRKGKVKAFMYNRITRDGQESTDFQHTIRQISSNPEHLVQLADILLHYDPKKGIDLERFKAQTETQATASLKERLEQVTDTKSKVRGDGSKITQTSFD